MSDNGPNDLEPRSPFAPAEVTSGNFAMNPHYASSGTQAARETPLYVHSFFAPPAWSGPPLYPSPPYSAKHSGPHVPQHPRDSPNRFAPTYPQAWAPQPQPQLPAHIPDVFPQVVRGTDVRNVRYAAPPVGSPCPRSDRMPPYNGPSAPPSGSSDTQKRVNGDAMRYAAHDSQVPGPSTLVVQVLEEITHSPETPASSACDFDGTLTLGDALRKTFSRISGHGSRRAFPGYRFAAKMTFLHMFNPDLGSSYRPRKKQVTVVTTRRSVVQQPSEARLAYLVAREMEKYLKECELRGKPFPYSLDQIVLRRIDLASRGTLRPRLFPRVRPPRSVRSSSAATC
ncbi:hypothetical protein GSI_13392 [Ganoderma sinense ZZ0214-1]|uniref:Uncharacterized protein n=1 Tax=Ganoderma sinense ZZ0214-1 TaxID=1077348 RepID=A0A2G8RVF9_9APHY|nr:hypothetical protein GSI_13392 [Ganoderma sinense ZZ0214-1]